MSCHFDFLLFYKYSDFSSYRHNCVCLKIGEYYTFVGIQGIDSDLEDAQYYTLDGLRIDNPAKGQIVIVRRGNNVSKMIVK